MKERTKRKKTVVSVLVLAGLVVFALTAIGGNLEPSAPPGSTMKTLDEVEPRIPIHASDLPLTISEPNSYYLAEDIDFTDTLNDAITIECNDVTIDLMGYTLKGPDSGTGSGIYMNGRTNVEVHNGTVRDFYYGVHETSISGKQHRAINVRAMSNEYYGIRLRGYGHVVKDCTAADNSTYGIYASYGSTVTGNTAYNNVSNGISTIHGCTVTGNAAHDNGSYGISVGSGCTVNGNTAYQNGSKGINTNAYCTVTGNTAYDNGHDGIYAGSGSTMSGNTAMGNDNRGIVVNSFGTITGNTVCYNSDYGISAGSYSTVSGNVLRGNNVSDTANRAGMSVYDDCLVKGNTLTNNKQNNIYVYNSGNAIEENLVTDCTGNGISFRIDGNFYANNRASGNGTDYANGASQTNGGGNYSF